MKTAKPFNVAAYVRSVVAGTHGKIESNESRAIADEIEKNGLPDNGYDPIPSPFVSRATTPLTAASPSGGGFLDQTNTQGYIPQLLPQMNLGRLGAKAVSLDKNSTVIPHGTTAMQITWLTNELTATNAATQGFGQVAVARKTVMAETIVTRQLLLQSNVDEILPLELTRQTAVAVDLAGIAGSGINGVPLGLLNNAAIPTASGATMTYAMLLSMMQAIANANAVNDPATLGFLTSPNVAGFLKTRFFSSANFPIWSGSIAAGQIDEQPAFSTTSMPNNALIHGDFSQLLIAGWSDGITISVDPFSGFQTGLTTIRLCVSVDFVVPNPAGFSVLNNIT